VIKSRSFEQQITSFVNTDLSVEKMIRYTDWMIDIPDSAITETFLAASGPGGQNVNKVETAVQMRVNVYALGLPPFAFRKLKQIAGRKMTAHGELIITVREHRTREANRTEARKRLDQMLTEAHQRDAHRIKTRPSRAAKARRVDSKKRKSSVKKMRGKPKLD
jgi:ribosome-associated protein